MTGCPRYIKDAAKLSAPAMSAIPTPDFTQCERNSFERMLHAANSNRESWRDCARTESRTRLLLKSVHSGARRKSNAVMARYIPNDVQATPHNRKNSSLYSRAYRVQNNTTRRKVRTSWR